MKSFITKLTECPEEEIPTLAEGVSNWPFPKTDFFHWIPVLNRFDSILEALVERYDLKHLQRDEFLEQHKSLLLAVLRLSTLLWENCTNRSIYNSYEVNVDTCLVHWSAQWLVLTGYFVQHLNELLLVRDLDVLIATVRLVLRPAQRLGSQRSLRNSLGTAQERVTILAQNWGTKQWGLEMDQLMDDQVQIPMECKALHFQFYRTASQSQQSVPEKGIPTEGPSNSTPSAKSSKAAKPSADKQLDGLTVIHIPDISSLGRSEMEIFTDLVEQYKVPEEHKYHLLHKIRLALGIGETGIRRKLLTVRLLAISVLGTLVYIMFALFS